MPASVSKTCLVRFDNNKYSVDARAPSAGRSRSRPMPIASSSARTARSSASIRRCFGRGETIYDPWHYVPVLARKPGALRNGAPFKDWVLPASLERVRRKLKGSDDGDRQMVKILVRGADRRPGGGRGGLRRGARRRRPLAPTSSSTSWPGSATPGRRRRS